MTSLSAREPLKLGPGGDHHLTVLEQLGRGLAIQSLVSVARAFELLRASAASGVSGCRVHRCQSTQIPAARPQIQSGLNENYVLGRRPILDPRSTRRLRARPGAAPSEFLAE